MTNVKDLAYRGYPTRETYDMSQWLNNEVFTYKHIVALAKCSDDLLDLSEKIETFFNDLEDLMPEFYKEIRYDVGSIWRVDWESIAELFEEFIPNEDLTI